MKVRLVIEGNVQGAGYRAMVKNVARRLKIKGLVRNLDDGNVEAFCECDKKTLNNLIKIIDRKGNPEQPFSLNVEKINVYKEGDVNWVGLPEKFGLFETDYRMEIDPVHKESLEMLEIRTLVLSIMHKGLKKQQIHDVRFSANPSQKI
ncbi:MAG: acylphosphatase [Thermoplasmatales archaeon]|nr:acylphosphatase [Thermoplasmatales archaeon]